MPTSGSGSVRGVSKRLSLGGFGVARGSDGFVLVHEGECNGVLVRMVYLVVTLKCVKPILVVGITCFACSCL